MRRERARRPTAPGIGCTASSMSTLSSMNVLQSVGSFGMVTWNVPVHGVAGARVSPSLMVAPPAVQLMSTTAPPGNGLCSVSWVTSPGKNPFVLNGEVTGDRLAECCQQTWTILCRRRCQSAQVLGPAQDSRTTSVPTAPTNASVSAIARRRDRNAMVMGDFAFHSNSGIKQFIELWPRLHESGPPHSRNQKRRGQDDAARIRRCHHKTATKLACGTVADSWMTAEFT